MTGRTGLLAATCVAAALALAGCGGGDRQKSAKGRSVDVKLTDAGCEPAELRLAAGPTTFEVANEGADAVTEFEILDGDHILGEVENVAPGLSGHFSLTLKPGRFTMYCPGGKTERGPLVVTGAAMLVSGWARAVQFILWTTTEQVHVPPKILNRLYAYDVSGCLSLLALGQAVAGPEADLFGVRASMLISAAAMIVGCTVILAVPAVRRLPATPAPPEGEETSDNPFTSAAPIDLKRWRRTRPLRDHGAA